jgi:Nitrous oxide-stimulated promoter
MREGAVQARVKAMTFVEPIDFTDRRNTAEAVKCSPARPSFSNRRLAREWKTIALMVDCYCHAHHGATTGLCPECQGLVDYAAVRLERCRFGVEKPTCAKCPVHCYQRSRREQVKTVMRYAGPRMVWRHPVLSLLHWVDSRQLVRQCKL